MQIDNVQGFLTGISDFRAVEKNAVRRYVHTSVPQHDEG
jgi:hypothetical protein